MVRAKKVNGYECPQCDEFYEDEEEAEDCCRPDSPRQVERFKCGDCDEYYEDREDAKECCKED